MARPILRPAKEPPLPKIQHPAGHPLLDAVWGYNFIPSTRTVDVHVAWLRQKLEKDSSSPQFIVTVHGLGYRFEG